MKRRFTIIIILVFVFLLASCELMVQQELKGVIRIVSVGIDYKNTNIDSRLYLNSTCNDAYQVGQVLKALGEKEGTEVELYNLISEHNEQTIIEEFTGTETQSDTDIYYPSNDNFLNVLNNIKAKQNSQDMLFIFLAGHGSYDEESFKNEYEITYGENLSEDYSFVMPGDYDSNIAKYERLDYLLSEYLSLVETISGNKVLINDFCFSGAMVSDDNITLDLTTYYYADHPSTADILFSSSNYVLDDTYILTAAQSYQTSEENSQHGNFTQALLDGLGWDETNQVLYSTIPVSSISINSKKIYLSNVANYTKMNDKNYGQTPKMTTSSNDIILFEF